MPPAEPVWVAEVVVLKEADWVSLCEVVQLPLCVPNGLCVGDSEADGDCDAVGDSLALPVREEECEVACVGLKLWLLDCCVGDDVMLDI